MLETNSLAYGPPRSYRQTTFALLHGVYADEIFEIKHTYMQKSWQGDPEIFGGYIALSGIVISPLAGGKFRLSQADIMLDNGETSVRIDRNFTETLREDPFVAFVVSQFRDMYELHDHDACKSRQAI